MRLYDLTGSEVEEMMDSPDWDVLEADGKTHQAWILRAELYFLIVYAVEGTDRVVITVGPRDRPPEESRS
jgi:hypothetical protein